MIQIYQKNTRIYHALTRRGEAPTNKDWQTVDRYSEARQRQPFKGVQSKTEVYEQGKQVDLHIKKDVVFIPYVVGS